MTTTERDSYITALARCRAERDAAVQLLQRVTDLPYMDDRTVSHLVGDTRAFLADHGGTA